MNKILTTALIFMTLTAATTIVIVALIRAAVFIVVSHSIKKFTKLNNSAPTDRDKKNKTKENSAYVNVTRIENEKTKPRPQITYDKEIVGIIKPMGKFSSIIMGEKISYLMQHSNKLKAQNSANYHQTKSKMGDTQGKGMGRGMG
ncbi:MAG: hypothetical protein LBB09_03170 [Rickettsiales bacterium]|jgi:cell division protein FtsW (lipid II flippase)|nr:hypothetical protein [Rickettsiales bacterium]